MASATLSLNNYDAAAKTFTLQGATQNETKWIDTASSLQFPTGISLKFNTPPLGSKANNRCTLTFFDADPATGGGVAVTTVKLELSVPRDVEIAESQTENLAGYLVSVLTKANLQKMMDGIAF